jgi:outer membrane protein TolC
MIKPMDLSIESSSHSRYILRFILAAMVLIAATLIGRAQGPLDPGSKSNEPAQSPKQNPSSQNQPGAKPESVASAQQPGASANRLARDEAVRLALIQASTFEQGKLAELIAAEDVRQARAAFLPRIAVPSTVTYNSPMVGPVAPGTAGADRFSYLASNAVAEYLSLVSATGEIDVGGRLRATLRRGIALLEAARAGTEVARRALIEAVDEAYYGLSLSTAKRRSGELSLAAAEDFARITQLMFTAGEVSEVDVIRARLQMAGRRDDLEQARVAEAIAAGGLRVLVGYDFATPIEVVDLTNALPDATEINRFVAAAIANRPEFAQLDAERRAFEQEAKAARAERLPQLSYSVSGGFDSQSLRLDALHDHTGVLATVSVTIPIFDWGASKSREQQARLRAQSVQSERNLAVRSFTQQFHAARTQAQSAALRYQILNASVSDAERNVQASLARYRGGEAAIIEVTDAQNTLATQRAALYQALFDYQAAKARLAQATAQ